MAISAISLFGTEWIPSWFLLALVFGVPALAMVIVLARTYMTKSSDPHE